MEPWAFLRRSLQEEQEYQEEEEQGE